MVSHAASFPKIHRSLSDRLRETNVPKLFISGSEDHLFLRMVKNYVRTDPLAILHILERCGHVCNIEDPAGFNQASINFITDPAISKSAYAVIDGLKNRQQIPAAAFSGQLAPEACRSAAQNG